MALDADNQAVQVDNSRYQYKVTVWPQVAFDIISHTSCRSTIWTEGAPVTETAPCPGFWSGEGRLKDRVKRDLLYPLLTASDCIADALDRAASVIEKAYRRHYGLDSEEVVVEVAAYEAETASPSLEGTYLEGVEFEVVADRCEPPQGQWLP